MTGLKTLHYMKGGYSSKFKTQEILKQLGYSFALENAELSNQGKLDIFYEDICDATGICLGIRMLQKQNIKVKKPRPVALSQVEVYYLEKLEDMNKLHGGFAFDVCTYEVMLNTSVIEKEIRRLVSGDSNQLYYTVLDTKCLGNFGLIRGFKYYSQGYGWLVFFHKDLAK